MTKEEEKIKLRGMGERHKKVAAVAGLPTLKW